MELKFSPVLGSAQTVFIGELGYQRANIGDSLRVIGMEGISCSEQPRYIRGNFSQQYASGGNKNDGFVTEDSWGYPWGGRVSKCVWLFIYDVSNLIRPS